MDLIKKYEFDSLPLRLQTFAISRIGKKSIRDLHPNQVRDSVKIIVNRAFTESGQTKAVTAEMLAFQYDTLIGELTGRFKDLTIEELQEAFKMGIRGEFGEYFGLCAATYHKFIKSYFERPERAESMRVYLDAVNKELTKELTPEEKRERLIKGIYLAYETYVKSNQLPYSPAPYYDFLWQDQKLINWTLEEKEEIKKEAKIEYEASIREKKNARQITAQQFSDLLNNLSSNHTYINTIKRIGLKRFFESCKLTNFKLELK
jgi:hypothetical protein